MQWIHRDGLQEAQAMITGRCKGKKPRRADGVLQPTQRSTNSACTFPSKCVLIFYCCTGANESWAEVWQCAVVLLAADKYCCSPALNQKPAASDQPGVAAAALLLMGSRISLCVQHSDLCCCRSPASACHFQQTQSGSELVKYVLTVEFFLSEPSGPHRTAVSSLPRGSIHQHLDDHKGNVSVKIWQGCSDQVVLIHGVDKSQPARSLL